MLIRKVLATILYILWKLYQKLEKFFYALWITEEPARIVVLFKAGIGNMILFFPALRLLRRRFKEAEIICICAPRGAEEILEMAQVINRVEIHPQSKIRDLLILSRKIRKKYKPDLVISAQPGISGSLLAFLSGAKRRIGFRYRMGFINNADFLYTYPVIYDRRRHEVERYFDLLRGVKIKQEIGRDSISLNLEKGVLREVEDILKRYNLKETDFLIGIHPGSFRDQKFKRWPIKHWQKLVRLLIDYYQAKVVILGEHNERGLGVEIAREKRGRDIFNFVAQTTLPQAAGIIQRCRFFVSNDSGLMHLSASVGTPVFAIFGPTNPVKNRPWTERGWVIKLNLKCQPCYKAFEEWSGCRYREEKCLVGLKPERVFQYIKHQLREYNESITSSKNKEYLSNS